MTSPTRDAESHRRTRRDHSSETAQDYVEAVAQIISARGTCRVVDLARNFAVSHVTVSRIVARLKEEGLLDSEPYGPVTLTTAGKKLASNLSSDMTWSIVFCWRSVSMRKRRRSMLRVLSIT